MESVTARSLNVKEYKSMKNIKHIVCITGRKGSGKSTVAKKFEQRGYTVAPMAASLKNLARELGWDGVKDAKGRKLLQLLGTDVCRNCISLEYWIDLWAEVWVENHPTRRTVSEYLVVDDVRFENELNFLESLGCPLTKIHVNDEKWYDSILGWFARRHVTESNFHKSPDYVINNYETLEDFHNNVLVVLDEVLNERIS